MSTSSFKSLYDFTCWTQHEVDQVTTRQEDDPANPGTPKTITETVKVKQRVPAYFAFKEPSRAEREEADVVRAVWWNRFVDRGIKPQAELMKTYGNVGNTISDEQKLAYRRKQADLLRLEQEMKRAEVGEPRDEALLDSLALKLVELRDDIIAFEREQQSFFENTAEAKAREKLIEYLVLHLSFHRLDETKDWEPFFKGATTEEKLAAFDRMHEAQDELLTLARSRLEFLGAVRASNPGPIARDRLEEFLKGV